MTGMRKAALILLGLIVVAAAALAVHAGGSPGQSTLQFNGAGDATGALDYPEGMTFDPQGKLLVVDTWNDRVVRFGSDGKAEFAFGKHGHRAGELECPRSAATDSQGSIYLVDPWSERIEKFSPQGQFLPFPNGKWCKNGVLGSKGAPKGYDEADGQFVMPYGVAVDSKGNIYVSDYTNNRIHEYDSRGVFVQKWGVEGRQDGQFSHPGTLVMDKQDRLYVSDVGNDRIQRFRVNLGTRTVTENGKTHEAPVAPAFDGQWGKTGHEEGELDRPYGVAVDPKGDSFYVADFGNHRVQKFDEKGRVVATFGSFGSEPGQLDSPMAVAVDGSGNLYVNDWGNQRIQKFAQ